MQEGFPLQKTREWTEAYTIRRYGLAAPGVTDEQRQAATAAWNILLPNSYSGYMGLATTSWIRRSIITVRPLFNLSQETIQPSGPLVDAWQQLQAVNQAKLGSFRYDLVDVGRQVMSNLFLDVYSLWQSAFVTKDAACRGLSTSMLELIADWDTLLLNHEAYCFGRWIADARRCAMGNAE